MSTAVPRPPAVPEEAPFPGAFPEAARCGRTGTPCTIDCRCWDDCTVHPPGLALTFRDLRKWWERRKPRG